MFARQARCLRRHLEKYLGLWQCWLETSAGLKLSQRGWMGV